MLFIDGFRFNAVLIYLSWCMPRMETGLELMCVDSVQWRSKLCNKEEAGRGGGGLRPAAAAAVGGLKPHAQTWFGSV